MRIFILMGILIVTLTLFGCVREGGAEAGGMTVEGVQTSSSVVSDDGGASAPNPEFGSESGSEAEFPNEPEDGYSKRY